VSALHVPVSRQVQVLWSLAVIVLLAGYFGMYRTQENGLGAEYDSIARVADLLERNAGDLRQLQSLEQVDSELTRRLSSIRLQASPSDVVALFIRETARIGSAHNVSVSAVEAPIGDSEHARPVVSNVSSDRTSRSAVSEASLFETIPLNLTIRGDYVGLLGTIRDLSHARVLAEVDLMSIERNAGAVEVPRPLVARLHIVLDRLNTGYVATILGRAER